MTADGDRPTAAKPPAPLSPVTVRLVALAAIVTVVAVLVVVAIGSTDQDRTAVPTWQSVVGFVVQLAGVALIVVQVVDTVRQRGASSKAHLSLPPPERRRLRRVVRRQEPVRPGELSVARGMASSIAAGRSVLLLPVALGEVYVGTWVSTPRPWRAYLALVFVLLGGALLVWMVRQVGTARAFLATTDDTSAPSPAG